MYCCFGVKQRCKLGKYTFHEVLIKATTTSHGMLEKNSVSPKTPLLFFSDTLH